MRVPQLSPGLSVGMILVGIAAALAAVPLINTDSPSMNTRTEPIVAGDGAESPSKRQDDDQLAIGNPLWAIPLKALSVTRERPVFSPSRRPPPPVVVAVPYVAPPPPPKPVEPERPPLSLVGTITGKDGSLGIFLDQATNSVVRLKTANRS